MWCFGPSRLWWYVPNPIFIYLSLNSQDQYFIIHSIPTHASLLQNKTWHCFDNSTTSEVLHSMIGALILDDNWWHKLPGSLPSIHRPTHTHPTNWMLIYMGIREIYVMVIIKLILPPTLWVPNDYNKIQHLNINLYYIFLNMFKLIN